MTVEVEFLSDCLVFIGFLFSFGFCFGFSGGLFLVPVHAVKAESPYETRHDRADFFQWLLVAV